MSSIALATTQRTGFQTPTDPMDFEIEPGRRVRDLATAAECASAVMQLDMDMESIMAQIGRSEADPTLMPAGWRTRAQSAMRWKKRVRRAVVAHVAMLNKGASEAGDKRRAILKTIRAEIGEEEFDRCVALAEVQNPHLDWSAS